MPYLHRKPYERVVVHCLFDDKSAQKTSYHGTIIEDVFEAPGPLRRGSRISATVWFDIGFVHTINFMKPGAAVIKPSPRNPPKYEIFRLRSPNEDLNAMRMLRSWFGEKSVNFNQRNENGDTAMCFACQMGCTNAVQLLLDNGADINKTHKCSWTPTYIACFHGHVDAVRLLLDSGAAIDKASVMGETPLYTACCKGYIDVVRLLLEKGAEVDKVNLMGETPLYTACCYDNINVAQFLLEKGAEVDKANNNEETPLFIACKKGHTKIVKLLSGENGANVDKVNSEGTSPLLVACLKNHINVAKILLETGANINLADIKGSTPLCVAIKKHHEDLVQLLSRYHPEWRLRIHYRPLLPVPAAKRTKMYVSKPTQSAFGADVPATKGKTGNKPSRFTGVYWCPSKRTCLLYTSPSPRDRG